MSSEQEEKTSLGSNGILHNEYGTVGAEQKAYEDDIARKTTKPGGRNLIPMPSDDPRDPLNWSLGKKITIFSIMVFGTFTGIATAVANVLATVQQAASWGVTGDQAAYSVSCVLAGIIIGPVLLVPLVRIFGVMSCCFWSALMVLVTSIWSAVSTGPNGYGSFLASRFIAGLFCATSQVFTGGVIANIFFVHQRGKAFAIYSSIYMIGQVGGPTLSGYIVQYVDWPVCFWWTVGANGLTALLYFLFGEDTAWDRENQQPVARKGIPETWWGRRSALFFPGTKVAAANGRENISKSIKAVFAIGLSPITILAGVYGLIFQGWFIMVGVQIPLILETTKAKGGYGFDAQQTSDFYFSAWIGALIAIGYGLLVNDRLPKLLQRRNRGVWRVEFRLHTAWFPSMIVGPIGCGLFGTALNHGWHWIVLAVAEAFIVFAAVAAVPPQTNYIIEIWKKFPQEVSAALNVWRISFAIAVQFFYAPWVDRVGVNWVWGTAAFVELFAFACLVVLMFFGPNLRRYNLWPDNLEEEPARQEYETED